jgi:hypothetical protein
MEHNFAEALFNLDRFFSTAPANVPDTLKHDWVKVHGLVYHKDNEVIIANQERDQAKGLLFDANERIATLEERRDADIKELATEKANTQSAMDGHEQTKGQRDSARQLATDAETARANQQRLLNELTDKIVENSDMTANQIRRELLGILNIDRA